MEQSQTVIVVDFGLGNLFSVKQACQHAGLQATVSSSKDDILAADALFLPGVGAFADAMNALHRLDLVSPILDFVQSGKMLIGICLGQQLLMTESYEFGTHKGLNLIEGAVVPFESRTWTIESSGEKIDRSVKIPQVGWNQIKRPPNADTGHWINTPLEPLEDGESMYFVHSYHAVPQNRSAILAETDYGDQTFCSSIHQDNIFSCQFHPERSGLRGLEVYRQIAKNLNHHTSLQLSAD